MVLPIDGFADYVFNKLYATSLPAALGLQNTAKPLPSSTTSPPSVSASTPTLTLTTTLLQNFSFSLADVERVFTLADGLQSLTGQGNNQLTQQEIKFYLNYAQGTAQASSTEQNSLLMLLLLDYYFEQLADINRLTPFGQYQAISLEQLRNLAATDGENANLTFQDIALYLQRKAAFVQSAEYSEMLGQQPDVIQKAGEKQFFIPAKAPYTKSIKRYQPMVERVYSTEAVHLSEKTDLPESDELATRMQVFSFSVSEILHLTRVEQGPVSLQDLEKSLKIVEAYQLDLERIMQAVSPGEKSSVCFSRALLTQQLEQARHSTAILRMLKQHFNEIATSHGGKIGISRADIEHLARLDGNTANLTLEDLKQNRKSNNESGNA